MEKAGKSGNRFGDNVTSVREKTERHWLSIEMQAPKVQIPGNISK